MKQVKRSESPVEKFQTLYPNGAIAVQSSRTKAIVLGAMCLALFMTNFDGTAVDVALPQLQLSLGANLSGLQWILNAYNLPVASLLLLSGTFGDVYGRQRVFQIGLLIFTIASALCGVAPNLTVLIAGRALQGIGAAAVMPLSLTILTETFPDLREKTKAIGIWTAVSALALIAGPALGGLLIDRLGWQSIFLVNVPLGILTFVLTARSVHSTNQHTVRHLDWSGIIFCFASMFSLTYLLIEGSSPSWLLPQRLLFLAVVVLGFLGFWRVESRSAYPMIPLSLLKNFSFVAVNLTQALVFFTSGGLVFMLSLFLQQVQGHSATATGIRFLPLNGAIILASLISGWIAARLGWRFPILSGLVLAGIATLSLIHIQADTPYSAILGSLILAGFGGGLTIPPLTSATLNLVPPAQAGIASAILNISIQFGGILGIAVQGSIFAAQFTAALQRSLAPFNLSPALQHQIIAGAMHNLTQVPKNLPPQLPPIVLHGNIQSAFVSGLHATLLIGGLALLGGAGLMLVGTPSKLGGRS